MTTVNQAVKELLSIESNAVADQGDAVAKFSDKQKQYALRTGALSVELGAKFGDVITGIEASNDSIVSKTKMWADPAVAPHVETIYKKAAPLVSETDKSITNIAYALGSKMKKGKAATATAAVKLWKEGKAEKAAEALLPATVIKAMGVSCKGRAGKHGWTNDQLKECGLYDALAVLENMPVIPPAVLAATKKVEDAALADTQLAATAAPAVDDDITAIMAGLNEGIAAAVTGAVAALASRK